MKTFRMTFIFLTLFGSLAMAAEEYPVDVNFPLECRTSDDAFTILNTRNYTRGDTTYVNMCMYYTYGAQQYFFCTISSPVSGSINVDLNQYTTYEDKGVRYRSYPFSFSTIWIDYGSCVTLDKN